MCRTFIQRSALHRMNSISSGSTCGVRMTAVVPSYSSTRGLAMRLRATKSSVIGVPGYGVGCWMYGQSTYFRANARLAVNRLAAIVGRANDEPADDEHAVTPEQVDRGHRRVGALALLLPAVLRPGLQERQVLVEHVLDAEKHVAESGPAHERREHLAVGRNGRGHRLHQIVEIVQARGDDRLAERLESRHVERDVVVHEKDGPRATRPGVGDVRDHAVDREAMEVPPAHLDDRAEAAVERAAA